MSDEIRRFEALFNDPNILVGLIDTDGTVLDVNETGMAYVEVEREAVVGKPFWETPWFAGDAELQQEVRQWIDRAVAGEYVDFEVDLSPSVGRSLIVSGVFRPVKNADDEVVSLLISGQDITERKYRQHELELRNRAIEEAPIGITIADADQSDNPLIYVNEAFEHLTGYDAEDILGRNCRILQGPETDSAPVARMREAIEHNNPVTVEVRNYRPDGTQFWNRVSISPIRDESGAVSNYVGFQQDITDRRERERELRWSERRFEAMFNDPNILVGLLATDGTVIDINETAMAYIDAELADVRGEVFWETPWWSKDLEPVVKEKVTRAANGEYVTYEADLTYPNGDPYSVLGTIRPVENDDGMIVSLIVSARDITQRNQREQQLDTMDRVLRHNLHNEMTVILGAAETIAEKTGETVADLVEMILSSGQRLLEVTNKQREIVELVSDHPDVTIVDVVRLVRQSIARMEQSYPEADIVLTTPDGNRARAWAVPQFGQAVSELLENAIVHADSVGPTVEVIVEQTATSVRVRVIDTGPRIPPAERAILRGEGDRGPLYHGNGMGLRLVNWIVTVSNGTVEYTENDPSGNVVELRLTRPSAEGVT